MPLAVEPVEDQPWCSVVMAWLMTIGRSRPGQERRLHPRLVAVTAAWKSRHGAAKLHVLLSVPAAETKVRGD